MKKLITVLLTAMLFIARSAYADWTLFNITKDNGSYFYYDKDNLIKNGNIVTVNTIINDVEKVSTAKDKHLSMKVVEQIDCKNIRTKYISLTVYDNHMGLGNVIKTEKSVASWYEIKSGSIADTLFDKVCK